MNDALSAMAAFLIGTFLGCLIIFFCKRILYQGLKKRDSNNNVSLFSTKEHLEEIEKVHLSILEERENQEPYIITLWWGLDGCRLNDAGEVEWISRREKPKTNYTTNYTLNTTNNSICFNNPYILYPSM